MMMLRRTTNVLRKEVARPLSTTANLSYTERQKKLNRPVSPHVTQYAFPVVALTSITQRITGVMLTVGVSGVAGASLAGADVAGILSVCAGSSILAPILKFSVAWPLSYHWLGGLRHVIWDKMPESTLYNEQAAQSSYAMIIASLLAGTAAALYTPSSPPPTTKDAKSM